MKVVKTVKMVEQVDVEVFADDGKKFVGENAERECAVYERNRMLGNSTIQRKYRFQFGK